MKVYVLQIHLFTSKFHKIITLINLKQIYYIYIESNRNMSSQHGGELSIDIPLNGKRYHLTGI